jgi:CelD/BcsL family acetyltransferase involved in cellulose biosynthesis
MQTVDSQFPGCLPPAPNTPLYLPSFLGWPGEATPSSFPSAASCDTAAGVPIVQAGDPLVVTPAATVPPAETLPAQALTPLVVPLAAPLRVRRIAPAAACNGRSTATFAAAEEIRPLAAVWNSLADNVPFRSFEWMESWWRHYSMPGWQTYLLAVENAAGQIVGIAPWYLSRSPLSGRVVQFLGSGEVCSEYQTILTLPGYEAAITAALVQWLTTAGARDWDLLLLAPTLATDSATAAFAEVFARRGNFVYQQPGMRCWQTELPATWDEFVQQLSKSRRQRVRQLSRKYFDTGRVTTRWVTSPSELDEAFPMFVDMHQRRRQSLGQSGCFASKLFAAFHHDVSRRLCAEGKLRLLWTELDGRPVGAEYDFIDGRTVYYYSTGVEPDATADHPGWLAMIGSLRRAIEEGCRRFDFLRGDEAYKCSWGAKPCQTLETRIVARRTLARFRHAAWQGRQQIRRWARDAKEWNTQRRMNQTEPESA